MSEKNEALRLARQLEACPSINYTRHAAELRRLHEENAELREANETFGRRQVWWNDRMFALEQQRAALLEALRYIADHDLSGADLVVCGHIAHGLIGRARDAIKAVEDAPDR